MCGSAVSSRSTGSPSRSTKVRSALSSARTAPGKTTMFNVVSRIYEPATGSVRFEGTDLLALPPHRISDLGVSRTFQNLALIPGLSVLDNVMIGAHAKSRGGFLACTLRIPPVRSEERRVRERSMEILGPARPRTSRGDDRAPACRTARSSASSSPGHSPPSPVC